MMFRRILANRMGLIGLMVIMANVVLIFVAPWVATHNPLQIDILHQAAPPSKAFLFGTDEFGRDIFSRVVYGARISLSISVLSVLAALLSGVIMGGISGYYGHWVDNIIMRCMDCLLYTSPSPRDRTRSRMPSSA